MRLTAAEDKFAQDAATAAASRDDEVAAQWAFHDFILGAKTQVKAQFGDSSNEIQALGLKKKSEYKSPAKKNSTTDTVDRLVEALDAGFALC